MNLKVDIKYYLSNQVLFGAVALTRNQIHPVISRLIEPIEGTDNVQVR